MCIFSFKGCRVNNVECIRSHASLFTVRAYCSDQTCTCMATIKMFSSNELKVSYSGTFLRTKKDCMLPSKIGIIIVIPCVGKKMRVCYMTTMTHFRIKVVIVILKLIIRMVQAMET